MVELLNLFQDHEHGDIPGANTNVIRPETLVESHESLQNEVYAPAHTSPFTVFMMQSPKPLYLTTPPSFLAFMTRVLTTSKGEPKMVANREERAAQTSKVILEIARSQQHLHNHRKSQPIPPCSDRNRRARKSRRWSYESGWGCSLSKDLRHHPCG